MNPYIRERIQRKLDTLTDDRLYQVLDYVEFLEAKYAERASSPVGLLQRFTEGVEDKMRAGGIAVSTITETMGLLNRATSMLSGVAQSTMSVASDVASAAARAVDQVGAPAVPGQNPNGALAGTKPPTQAPQAGSPPLPPPLPDPAD
ncbi:MAG: hypothetical protein H7Z40_00175 [Phycisphaerae bacterium]|nr:hypothetical protein [Gemmatimonadaceae bacterium]